MLWPLVTEVSVVSVVRRPFALASALVEEVKLKPFTAVDNTLHRKCHNTTKILTVITQ